MVDNKVNKSEVKTIKQHFVPQFYLRNFEDDEQKLYAYNRQQDKFIESRAKDICFEKYLYETLWENANLKLGTYILPNQIENEFSRQESKYSALLKSVISICLEPRNEKALICSQVEKSELALFVANMLLRHPWSLRQADFDNIADKFMSNDEIQLIDQMLQRLEFGGLESLIKASSKKVWLDSTLNNEENVPVSIARGLQKMFMSFLVAEGAYFITSSFPVIPILHETKDGKMDCQSLFLPLCPNIVLQYTKSPIMKPFRNRRVSVFPKTVMQINRLYLEGSQEQVRYLISHDNESLRRVLQ